MKAVTPRSPTTSRHAYAARRRGAHVRECAQQRKSRRGRRRCRSLAQRRPAASAAAWFSRAFRARCPDVDKRAYEENQRGTGAAANQPAMIHAPVEGSATPSPLSVMNASKPWRQTRPKPEPGGAAAVGTARTIRESRVQLRTNRENRRTARNEVRADVRAAREMNVNHVA